MQNISIYLGEGVEAAAKEQVLSSLMDMDQLGDVHFFHSFRDLVNEVTQKLANNEDVGQILNASSKSRIDNSIRHDLKNLPGFDYEKAEAVKIRYSECPDPLSVPALLTFIHDAVNAVVSTEASSDGNDIKKDDDLLPMDALRAQMNIPSREVTVIIVDDKESEIEGMYKVLSNWENIKVVKFLIDDNTIIDAHEKGQMPTIPYGDIILLDEAMVAYDGTEYYKNDLKNRADTIVVSTTGGVKPDWAYHHIKSKSSIAKELKNANAFIAQINSLLPSS